MDSIEIAETCEKAAAFLEEKGRIKGELWVNENVAYQDGPACLVGALAISAGHCESVKDVAEWFDKSGLAITITRHVNWPPIIWNDRIATDEEVTTMLRDVAKKKRDNG